ncbi:hypothetical protein D3C75_933400 [compost metagenome]
MTSAAFCSPPPACPALIIDCPSALEGVELPVSVAIFVLGATLELGWVRVAFCCSDPKRTELEFIACSVPLDCWLSQFATFCSKFDNNS